MANCGEGASQFGISEQEVDKLVSEVIRYALFKIHQTSGCPIKREELSQLVTKSYRQHALPTYVISRAKEKLSSIFGYELRELQRSRPSSTNQPHGTQSNILDQKSYVVLSKLPVDVYKKHVDDGSTAHLTGFAFVVISIVYLAGGKITEDGLWHHLKRMGLTPSNIHPELGDPKQVLETLVQKRYLQKQKVNAADGNTLFFELAERALDAPVIGKVKEYILQIVNKDVAADPE